MCHPKSAHLFSGWNGPRNVLHCPQGHGARSLLLPLWLPLQTKSSDHDPDWHAVSLARLNTQSSYLPSGCLGGLLAQPNSAGNLMPQSVKWSVVQEREQWVNSSLILLSTLSYEQFGDMKIHPASTRRSWAFYTAVANLGDAPLIFALPPSLPHSPLFLPPASPGLHYPIKH